MMVSWCLCASALGAMSAENNPSAPTGIQAGARMARIQQEVDRLRATGMFAQADAMSDRLQHFRLQVALLEGSQVSGPELDAIGMYKANGDSPVVKIHETDRPVVLVLSGHDLIHWTLNVDPGAKLQKVIVSGSVGAEMPSGVPAGVPVEVFSSSFYFYSETDHSFGDAARAMYAMTGLPPTTMQAVDYRGQQFAVGGTSVEWSQERVLSELQPLYKEATAPQLAQDRAGADQYRFTGLYRTYLPDGTPSSARVAQMTPLGAIEGTIQPKSVNYASIAVDPRGPAYYAMSASLHSPVRFDPVTGQETAVKVPSWIRSITGMTFDTRRNQLVMIAAFFSENPGGGLVSYSPDDGTWQALPPVTGFAYPPLISWNYSPAGDFYFSLAKKSDGGMVLNRLDATGTRAVQIELSQFINCGINPCQVAASGDRLILIASPVVDYYEPLSPLAPHSYLIDPANGNVSFLGALPEPGGMMAVLGLGILLRRRTRR